MRIVADLRAVLQNWAPKSQILRVQFAFCENAGRSGAGLRAHPYQRREPENRVHTLKTMPTDINDVDP